MIEKKYVYVVIVELVFTLNEMKSSQRCETAATPVGYELRSNDTILVLFIIYCYSIFNELLIF